MQIQCPACHHVLSTEGAIPRFCSACGSSLSEVTGKLADLKEGPEKGSAPNSNFEPTLAISKPTRANTGPRDELIGFDETIDNSGGAHPPTLPENSFVGPFKIVDKLGQGGMGTVYRATHSQTGQTVALKLLSRSVRTNEETIQRFQRESQIAASINHPRSTFVYQAGQHEGQFYITMELMTGGTLADVVNESGPIPFANAVDHILDIISGLRSAHSAGIVHRDLKPSNCFVDQTGRVKVGDFGLAKSFMSDTSLTQTGAFMGTPQYAAPEQLRASEVDERADIYAIGGTLFYLLTGRAPFVGNAAQVIASITSEKPPRVDSLIPTVPRELSRIINQTLEKDPARRPENLDALRQALLPYSSRGISSADVGRRLAAFFVDIAVVFIGIMFMSQFLGMFLQLLSNTDMHQVFFLNIFVVLIASVGYFSISEWRFGTTLGKWLLGMRVITEANQSPGLGAAAIRATLMPGISYVLGAIPPYVMELDPFQLDIWTVLIVQFLQLLSWLPCLICFVSARQSNGMRGLHEILSGTRVVRLSGALEYQRPRNVPVTAPILLESPESFGEFTASGLLGRRPDNGSTVLLGRDQSLDRDVWIVKRASLEPPKSWGQRKSLARPTRLRILDEKIEGDHRWVVTEAIKGMPLVDYVTETPNIDWSSFRPLLRELAYELAKSEQDSTAPSRLSLRNAWIDQSGRAKLLDQPIMPPMANADQKNEPEPNWLTPFEFVAGLLDTFIENQVVPAHVLTFRKELEIVRTEPDSLRTIGQRLGELADHPSHWRWDDRLGVLAISIGIEYASASSIASTLALAVAFFFDLNLGLFASLTILMGSLAALLLGFCFGGGPIFRLSGVMVRRNKTLEPASKLRCAFRNFVAWLPFVLMMACLAVLFELFFNPETLAAMQQNTNLENIRNPWFAGAVLLSLPLLLIMALAPVYAVLKPSRSIPDVIAGTRLIRK